ncbi:hypothetical protein CCH79_00014962 [Gambusia affinis]|uniref:Protein FAM180A n=1 Tax=Gambusia affinis TaxID=33528 RepID=A0A315WEY0_GAMAF|nr:hypothetical protein CCH79_00014962 [Gambusia affinis]
MARRWWALLAVVYLSSLQAAARHQRKDIIFSGSINYNATHTAASTYRVKDQLPSSQLDPEPLPPASSYLNSLFPSAYLIKRGAYSLINPTFLHSEEDAKLLFEILLAGMQIQGEERPLLIPDEELASLRSVKTLEVICEDVLPKKLSDIRRLMADLAQRRRPLSWQDFERTVLTLVYSSQILSQISNQHQKELWMETLVQLVRAVQRDLTPAPRVPDVISLGEAQPQVEHKRAMMPLWADDVFKKSRNIGVDANLQQRKDKRLLSASHKL